MQKTHTCVSLPTCAFQLYYLINVTFKYYINRKDVLPHSSVAPSNLVTRHASAYPFNSCWHLTKQCLPTIIKYVLLYTSQVQNLYISKHCPRVMCVYKVILIIMIKIINKCVILLWETVLASIVFFMHFTIKAIIVLIICFPMLFA